MLAGGAVALARGTHFLTGGGPVRRGTPLLATGMTLGYGNTGVNLARGVHLQNCTIRGARQVRDSVLTGRSGLPGSKGAFMNRWGGIF